MNNSNTPEHEEAIAHIAINASPSFSSSTPSLSVRARRALYETTLGARRGNVPHVPLGDGGSSPLKRRPLGFLSPNFLKQSRPGVQKQSTATRSTETNGHCATSTGTPAELRSVSQLQQEISDLQYRLDVIRNPEPPISNDCDADATAVEFTLSTKDYQHVQELNQKLQQIQTGLLDIEGERCILVARAQQLEQEKEQLGQQLRLREREIETLQKRCAAAAEQSKINASLRGTNQQLEHALQQLQNQPTPLNSGPSDEHAVQLMELQVQLQQSQAARHALAQRLQNVQRDHDGVCASLQQCLANVERLTNETAHWEEERLRLCDEYESQLERQRIDHMQAMTQLRGELKERETKVHDLDRLLQEKVMSMARLRQQLVALETSKAEAIQRMNQECQETIQRVQEECDKTIENQVESKLQLIVNQCLEQEISFAQDEISALQDKLAEKSAEIDTLRHDVSVHMEKLMVATTELQKLQDDSAMLDSLFQDVETLECERHHLSEKLHDKDMEIAELSAEILKLEIEKELAGQNSLDAKLLNEQLEAAEQESKSSLQRLHQVEAAYQGLANEIRRLNEDNDETVARIRSEYDEAIHEMQLQLQRAEMAVPTDGIAVSAPPTSVDNLASSHIARLECEVRRWHTQALELERQMVATTVERTTELDDMQQTVNTLRHENDTLQDVIHEKALHMEQAASKFRRSTVEADNTIDRLEDQVRQLQATIADLERQNETQSRHHLCEIESLTRRMAAAQSVTESSEAQMETIVQEYQNTISKLTVSVTDIKRERDFSQMSLETCRRKLEEESLQLAQTTQSYRDLAVTETGLRDECRQLRNERDTLLLERECDIRDSGAEASLRTELALAEQKLVSHDHQMAALEEALQDRTTLLANMVSHNKELETKLDRSESQFKSMEARSSHLQVCLLDKEDEMRRLQAVWQKQEDEYLEKIHIEHNLREVSESDLAAAMARLDAIRVSSRDLTELEKENNLLKDKIRRQEAYLQRKIEQEKAARERAVPGSSVKAPASAPKVPAVLRTSTSGSKGGSAKHGEYSSKATRSTAPETESTLDIELETLLAD